MIHFAVTPSISVFLSLPLLPTAAPHASAITTFGSKLCFVCACLCVCVCNRERGRQMKERACAQKRKVYMWECLAFLVGVPVRLQNHLNWERNAGVLARDSDRSQISLSEKSPTSRLAISQWLEKEWKKERGRRDWKREEMEVEKGGLEMHRE